MIGNLKNNPIWYKFENRAANMVRKLSGNELIHFCEEIKSKECLEIAASTFILKLKRPIEAENSITLDENYFEDHCNNDFKKLVGMFNISRTNPVKVTRPETIQLIVKAPGNREFYFDHPRIGSLDEVIEFIKSKESLTQFITNNTIFRGKDKQALSSQHLTTAQQSGIIEIFLSGPDVDTGSEIHKENFRNAFDVEYVDNNNIIKNFLVYLNRKHKTWKSNTHDYVPYSTIFQSSGYGKSRLVKEVAKRTPTIYLCLRDANSTGYPPRTSIGADLFERVLKGLNEGEEWRLLYILQIIIQCFKEELTVCNNNNEKFWNNQMDTEFCERIWTKVQNGSSNWKTISHNNLISSANFLTANNDIENNNVCLLFCIDEARVLILPTVKHGISPFRFLRRALRGIKWSGFFVLLLDTLSMISNFAPPKSADSSSHDTSDLPFKLFYPYFRITTMDVFESNTYENVSWDLAKFGQPLYISYLKSCNDDPQAMDKLKNLLLRKLLGGANSFESSKQEISSLAILSSVIGFEMSPQSQLASELVASHMATCLSISEDRERLIVAYPSEPLLSEVALEFMSDLMLSKILWLFSISLKKGLVDPGPRGELVGRIILAVVAHKLSRNGLVNKVQTFLTELYHHNSLPKDLDNFSREFIEGSVAFTHFNAVHYVPEKEDLEVFYKRRCAFIMKRNHPGADICIPVKLATDTDKYSLIIIQIKNINTTSTRADENYPASAKSMLHCNYVFEDSNLKDHQEPCLCLYWQFGYNYHFKEMPFGPTTRSNSQFESNNYLHLATFGLTHYKFNSIKEILSDILTSYISPFDSEWKVNNIKEGDNWKEDEIRIIHPLSYGKFEEKK
ncbi:6307_t:CDS:2 [Funneliformis geosporum]|nr:6307_t:CDS:2 [Funneliformis geosporum]